MNTSFERKSGNESWLTPKYITDALGVSIHELLPDISMMKQQEWTLENDILKCEPDEFITLSIKTTDFGEFFEYSFWVKHGIRVEIQVGKVTDQRPLEELKKEAVLCYIKWRKSRGLKIEETADA